MIKKLLDQILSSDPTKAKQKQLILMALIVLALFITIFAIQKIVAAFGTHTKENKNITSDEVKITLASDVVDGNKVWAEYFETALKQEREIRQKDQEKLIEEFQKAQIAQNEKYEKDIERLENQLQATEFNLRSNLAQNDSTNYLSESEEKFKLNSLGGGANSPQYQDLPKNISLYIPSSTYVKGRLLSGISVSTGISAQSDPVPLIIRLTDDASLPGLHKIGLKNCRILGSCRGDISSERAIIRIENLVCVDDETQMAVETKVAGFVVGQDGINGIRGTVISMDTQHIKNAAIGGFLSGFSQNLKNEGGFALNPSIGIVSEKSNLATNLKNNAIDGAISATDKLANYYIQKAESISPVIEVPGGALVDIVFTEGVYFGQQNTRRQIEEFQVQENQIQKIPQNTINLTEELGK